MMFLKQILIQNDQMVVDLDRNDLSNKFYAAWYLARNSSLNSVNYQRECASIYHPYPFFLRSMAEILCFLTNQFIYVLAATPLEASRGT